MTWRRRSSVMLLVVLIAAVAMTTWSFRQLAAAEAASGRSRDDLVVCRQLARRIGALRHKPALAGSQELQLNELARRIEQACQSADVPPDSLVRIWPEQARRVGDTNYKEKPTQILLRQVTLRHIIRFLHALTGDESGLWVKTIRLVAPRDGHDHNHWTAEATISYLIYTPKDQSR